MLKPISAGDFVLLRGRGKVRLVVVVSRSVISFVRVGSSYLWLKGQRNATAFYDLPITLRVLRRGTARSIELAKRFERWLDTPVEQYEWDAV